MNTRSQNLIVAVALALVLLSCRSAAEPQGPADGFRPLSAPAQWRHDWARGAVFYEIFVRSFADSNGDGIGDFNGLTSRLDYLNDGDPETSMDLGIDGIWLMPIFESTSYHGYDTIDYEAIERDYGTREDFQHFVDEAHKRGIRVIVDLVLNHTSIEHPWFIDSASSTRSARRDWYLWSATDPGWRQPWGGNDPSWHYRNVAYYYGAFWSGMPDLNYRNAAARSEMLRVARHWLTQGIDGYRLDATRYLIENGPGESGQADTPGTHQLLKELSADVRRIRPDAILVAENVVDTPTIATYFGSIETVSGGDEMPMNFNFPLAAAIVEGVRDGDATVIRTTLAEMTRVYPEGIIDTPFLTNHDQIRLATVLGTHPRKLRTAAAILLTLPGMPFLYYGEEIGLQNGPGSADELKRTPMPWTSSGGFTTATPWHPYAPGIEDENVASQLGDPRSLLSSYRNWIAVRRGSSALRQGDITPLQTGGHLLAFVRDSGDERVLVAHNLSAAAVEADRVARGAKQLESLYIDSGVSAEASADSWRISLPPHSSGVWRLIP